MLQLPRQHAGPSPRRSLPFLLTGALLPGLLPERPAEGMVQRDEELVHGTGETRASRSPAQFTLGAGGSAHSDRIPPGTKPSVLVSERPEPLGQEGPGHSSPGTSQHPGTQMKSGVLQWAVPAGQTWAPISHKTQAQAPFLQRAPLVQALCLSLAGLGAPGSEGVVRRRQCPFMQSAQGRQHGHRQMGRAQRC